MRTTRDNELPEVPAEAAAYWFVRLQDEDASGDDWLAFETWLAASPANAAAYEHVEGVWVDLDGMGDDVAAALDAPISLDARRNRRDRPDMTRRVWLAAGAGLAASVAIGVGLANYQPAVNAEVYTAAPGETRGVTLADGSHVWLNAGTRLTVRMERKTRRVEMADGEAVFDVTHDAARPFLIDTHDREVRVVGTQFNLRQRDDRFSLTVRRGLVEVRPSGQSEAKPTRVAAGQQLIHRAGAAQATLVEASPEAAFAWTQGQLVYSEAPLSDVAADLSRSLGTPIRVADASTGQVRFTGVLTIEDPDTVLKRLEAFAPVRAERQAGTIVLQRR